MSKLKPNTLYVHHHEGWSLYTITDSTGNARTPQRDTPAEARTSEAAGVYITVLDAEIEKFEEFEEESRYWVLDTLPSDDRAQHAFLGGTYGIVDEVAGGIIAYAAPGNAERIVKALEALG